MKRLFITILIPLLTVSLAASAKITFEKTELDFGELESGKVVDLEFKFENAGDEILIIKNISSSCGCTVTKVEKKEYQPAEKGVIPVKFFSRGYNGKITKTITVSTNDPENVYSRLKISGNVVLKDFAAWDIIGIDRVEFKEVSLGEKYTEKIVFKNTGTIDLRIIEVVHAPEISPEFDKKIVAPNEKGEISIVFKPLDAGRFAHFLRIRTNAYKQRSMIIKVSAEIKGTE
ncbi:MAG: DUF1573 domain-containing protein [Candidatus Aminicenantes bacterium]|nr:MAG: DUF1573 domain-containing protein [Candidatus Aminicenantes bacterium]